ncbi:hypothetical protein [Streptacidiphilus rugosus]|uniref:hypothetical protein n=1 Tax=Streptacidiphilus rugosus TaxID=405783 RepID=UPI00056970E6|nr:hypothetical protein [Streptacidiphilus rugosus]
MSENEHLRSQLVGLVEDRPDTPSPAALVIAKVRRGRRRRAAAGAFTLAAAVLGGLLVGLPHADRTPTPAKPVPLCTVALPQAWTAALGDPSDVLHRGTLLAAAPDGSVAFVQDGSQVVQLTDHFATRRVVMTLPATPPAAHTSRWTVSGHMVGDWFAFDLIPQADPSNGNYLGLYAWNHRTGVLRTLLPAGPSPSLEMNFWTLGPGYLAWDSSPYETNGFLADGSERHTVENLDSGSRISVPHSVNLFSGDIAVSTDLTHNPTAVSAATGQPAEVPAPLRHAFRSATGMASVSGDGIFVWSTDQLRGTDDHGASIGVGSHNWHIWWPSGSTVLQIAPPAGTVDMSVVPIGADFLVVDFGVPHVGKPYVTGQRAVLVDLRSHSSAPLPMDAAIGDGPAFAPQPGDAPHVLATTTLPRLPRC